jgi:hypothetical protein
MPRKYWMGPLEDECNICHKPFGKVMYDCKIGYTMFWGNICRKCFVEKKCKLGTGFGQKYELQKSKRWLKTGG